MIGSYRCCLQVTSTSAPNHTYRCCLARQTIRPRTRGFITQQGEPLLSPRALDNYTTKHQRKKLTQTPYPMKMKPCPLNLSINTHVRRTKRQATIGNLTPRRKTVKTHPSSTYSLGIYHIDQDSQAQRHKSSTTTLVNFNSKEYKPLSMNQKEQVLSNRGNGTLRCSHGCRQRKASPTETNS